MQVKFKEKFVCFKAHLLNLSYKVGPIFIYQYNHMVLINQITYERYNFPVYIREHWTPTELFIKQMPRIFSDTLHKSLSLEGKLFLTVGDYLLSV